MEQYIINDILHTLLIICDIDTYPNMIVNKHIYNYCDQVFWRNKLKYYQLPYIKHTTWYVFKSTLYAQQLAKKIMLMNKNTHSKYISKNIIEIDFTRNNKFDQIQLPTAFDKAMTFNFVNYDIPCEFITLKLKNNNYHVTYSIQHYDTGEVYLKLKILCNNIETESILITLLYGSFEYKKDCYVFHTYFTNEMSITNEQQDNYVVYKETLVINDDYDKN